MRAAPFLVLQSILRAQEKEEVKPFEPKIESKEEMEVFEKYEFIKDDPSKFYDIVKRIGVGGFAKVFEVKRKSDGKAMALKFIEPRND